jgi:hypothetical protein
MPDPDIKSQEKILVNNYYYFMLATTIVVIPLSWIICIALIVFYNLDIFSKNAQDFIILAVFMVLVDLTCLIILYAPKNILLSKESISLRFNRIYQRFDIKYKWTDIEYFYPVYRVPGYELIISKKNERSRFFSITQENAKDIIQYLREVDVSNPRLFIMATTHEPRLL